MDSVDQNFQSVIIKLEKTDVKNAAVFHFKKITFSPLNIFILVFAAIIFAGLLYYFIDYRGVFNFLIFCKSLFISFISLGFGLAFIFFANTYVLVKKAFGQQKGLHRSLQFKWNDADVHMKSEVGDVHVKWDEFIKLRENKHVILLYLSDYFFFILPKRFMTNEQAATISNAWRKRAN